MSASGELSSRQVRAIALLLGGMPERDVAKQAGIDARTLRRWLDNEHFRAELKRGTSKQLRGASIRLVALLDSAITQLGELLDGDIPPGVKLRAVMAAGELAGKYIELAQFDERIEALELAVFHVAKSD